MTPHKPTVDYIFSLIQQLTMAEKYQLARKINEEDVALTVILGECGLWDELLKNAEKASIDWQKAWQEIFHKLKKRNRRSDPEIVKRNVEICNLRQENPTLWSQGKLGRKFGINPRTVRKILAEEKKWRDLMDEIGTE
jgi:hypothetical protein